MNNETRRPPRGPMGGHGPMRGGHGNEKAKDLKGTLLQLLRYLGSYRYLLLLALLFAIGATIIVIVGPDILGNATTELANGLMAKAQGTGGIDFQKIYTIIMTLVGLYLVSMICSYVQGYLMATISQKTCYRLRKELSEKINTLPLRYFDQTSQGDVLSRVTNDIDMIGQGLNQSMSQILTSIVQIIGIAFMMIKISWIMSLVSFCVIPISGILILFVTKRSQRYFISQQTSLGLVNGHVEEMYGGHTVVKAFNKEADSLALFNEYNDKLYESAWKSQFLSGLMHPITQFIGNVGYVFVVLIGGILATHSKITLFGIVFSGVGVTIGNIQSFIQYVRMFNQPISQAAQIMNMLQSTAAAGERVFAFLQEEEEIKESETPISIYDENNQIKIEGSVAFEDVRFGYTPDKIVIKHFSMYIKDGQKVAIVGPTGAGKTTIVKLLMRFYELDHGTIYVGGHNIKEYRRSDLRSLFGMVLQDAWLFSGSVMDNLRYSKLNASDEEVYAAAKSAHVDHFIKTLEHGYDTELNEETSNISQGQKQLLTIARAFLADPKILILDEATSNVDTRTEVLIQEGMEKLMKGRTSFIIAHRLSTIRNADIILVMNEGDIVEVGDHEELLARGGFYATLYNSQFAQDEE